MKHVTVFCLFVLSVAASASTHRKSPQHLRTAVFTTRANLTLDAQATIATIPNQPLYCEFSAFGYRKAWAIFDPRTGRAWIRSGHPKKTVMYSNVTLLVGQPPYGDGGFTVVAFGDVPLFSVRMKNPTSCPLFAFVEQVFDPGLHATWAKAPGGPMSVIDAGYCGVGAPLLFEWDDFKGW